MKIRLRLKPCRRFNFGVSLVKALREYAGMSLAEAFGFLNDTLCIGESVEVRVDDGRAAEFAQKCLEMRVICEGAEVSGLFEKLKDQRKGHLMGVFVALYRGINVGGKASVKMEALRGMHERLGHEDVKSYIQSGNVVFGAKGSAEGIGQKVAAEFLKVFGFEVQVMVVEGAWWIEMAEGNPYAEFAAAEGKTVHAGVFRGGGGGGDVNEAGLKGLLAKTGGREAFVVGKGVVYLHAPDGFGTSKFAAGMEKASGVAMTVRNWKTVEAIAEMVEGRGERVEDRK
jgi:uncharacterized protein (DUF1697 family)